MDVLRVPYQKIEIRGVNVWPNSWTRHEPDTGFFGLGLGLINGLTQKRHDKKRVISRSTRVIHNRHVWHANLFVSTRNDPLNTTRLTHITNKYLLYFRFVKYLLNPTYILNLKRKVSNYKNLKGNGYNWKLKLYIT